MQIQVQTDTHTDAHDEAIEGLPADLESALSRFGDRITRVEANLSDENADRSEGLDKKCMLEVRLIGQPPVAVTHAADSVADACSGAVQRLVNLLESKDGKARQHKGAETIRHLEVTEELI